MITPCMFADDISDIKRRIKHDQDQVLDTDNSMVANTEKFQAIFMGTKDSSIKIEFGSTILSSSKEVELLGVTIDRQLSFLPHISQICKKASAKTKALMRKIIYLTQYQADLFSSFIIPCLLLTIVL